MSWDTSRTDTVVYGTDYTGTPRRVAIQDGHMEVRVSDPDGWGGVAVVEAIPVVQESFAYGIGPRMTSSVGGSGVATAADSLMSCATGTTIYAYASVATILGHYRAGQELIYEFTARFTAGVVGYVQIAGPHTGGDGAGFGFDGTSFGLLTRRGGKRAVAVLTVAVASSASATGTVRLNGTDFTTPTLTNVGSTAGTAAEIAAGTYTGWTQQAVGSTVVFVQSAVGTASAGTYTFTHASASGTFPGSGVTTEGAAVVETWVPQASWNQDKFDGSLTPTILDPTKLNAYRVRMRYLGVVGFFFDVYDPYSHHWTPVHRPTNANSDTVPFVINPSLPMRWTAGSVGGSGTNITVYGASCKIAVGGPIDGTPITRAATGYNAAVGATLLPLVTVSVARAFASVQPSFIGALLNSIGAASYHTRPIAVHLVKNATLTGARFARLSADSGMLFDTAATGVSGGTELFIMPIGPDGEYTLPLRGLGFHLDPGETWTLAAVTDSGTGADVRATMTFQELR